MATMKPIGKDFTGYEVMTQAVKDLLNQYPGLYDGEEITFEGLGKNSGIAFSSDNGALIYTEKEDVTGRVTQRCRYPFYIIYRTVSTAGEKHKMAVQGFLDGIGRWLCREPVEIEGKPAKLSAYPKLAAGRTIQRISRDNFYGLEPDDSGVQDWLLPVSVEYMNEFER